MMNRWLTFWLLLTAMGLAVQVVGVSEARASCGDYLIHGGSGPHELARPNRDGREPLPIPNTPCRGPGCQKAPSKPFLPVPARLASPQTERLGFLSDSLPLPAESRTALDAEFAERPMAGYLLSIEHPPRATR